MSLQEDVVRSFLDASNEFGIGEEPELEPDPISDFMQVSKGLGVQVEPELPQPIGRSLFIPSEKRIVTPYTALEPEEQTDLISGLANKRNDPLVNRVWGESPDAKTASDRLFQELVKERRDINIERTWPQQLQEMEKAAGVKPEEVQQLTQVLENWKPATDAPVGLVDTVKTIGAHGSLTLVDQYARAIRATQTYDTTELINDIGKRLEPYQKNLESMKGMQRTIAEGLSQIIPSLGAGVPGAIAGMVGGPAGTVAGFATSAGVIFGLAEYDRFMEEAEKQGLRREDVWDKALISAIAEGGFEALSDVVGGRILKLWGPLKPAAKTAIAKSFTQIFGRTLAVAGVEAGTEAATAAVQAERRKAAKIPTEEPWEAAKAAIGPSVVMSLVLGPLGVKAASLRTPTVERAAKPKPGDHIVTEGTESLKIGNSYVVTTQGEFIEGKETVEDLKKKFDLGNEEIKQTGKLKTEEELRKEVGEKAAPVDMGTFLETVLSKEREDIETALSGLTADQLETVAPNKIFAQIRRDMKEREIPRSAIDKHIKSISGQYTTLYEDAKIRQRPIELAVKEKPTAEFIGYQTGIEGEQIPLYNITGGERSGSTVTQDTLKELGIKPPAEKIITPPRPAQVKTPELSQLTVLDSDNKTATVADSLYSSKTKKVPIKSLSPTTIPVQRDVTPVEFVKIHAVTKNFPKWLRAAGLQKAADRINLDLRGFLDIDTKLAEASIKEHQAKGRAVNPATILGATHYHGANATLQLAYNVGNLHELEKATYHELYHLSENWLQIPDMDMDRVREYFPLIEDRADAFAAYVMDKKSFVEKPTALRKVWDRIEKFLIGIRDSLKKEGIENPEELFGKIRIGAYREIPEIKKPTALNKKDTDYSVRILSAAQKKTNFLKFLRDSAVRIMVYHGTYGDFVRFDLDKETTLGHHFGSTPEQANKRVSAEKLYTKRPGEYEYPQVMPAYIRLENPLRMRDIHFFNPWTTVIELRETGVIKIEDELKFSEFMRTPEVQSLLATERDRVGNKWIREKLQSLGYDGIVYNNEYEGKGDSYIVFNSNAIKSIWNYGTYSDLTDNISLAVKTAKQEHDEENTKRTPKGLRTAYRKHIGDPLWQWLSDDLPLWAGKKSEIVDKINKGIITDYRKDPDFISLRDNTLYKVSRLRDLARQLSVALQKLEPVERIRASQIIKGSITTQSEKYNAAFRAAHEFQKLEKELIDLGILGPDNRFRSLTKRELAKKFRDIEKIDSEIRAVEKKMKPIIKTEEIVTQITEDVADEIVSKVERVIEKEQARVRITKWTKLNEARVKEAITSRGFAEGEADQMIQRIKDSVVPLEGQTGTIASIRETVQKTVNKTIKKEIVKTKTYSRSYMARARGSLQKDINALLKQKEEIEDRIKTHYKMSGKQYLRRAYQKIDEEKTFVNSLINWVSGFKRPRLIKGYDIKRKELSKEYRQFLGEIEEAPYLVMKGLSHETHDAELMKMFVIISQNKNWAISKVEWENLQKLGDKSKEWGKVKNFKQLPETERLGPLNGAMVDPYIWDDLNETVRVTKGMSKIWDSVLRLWKTGKVVYNPATQVRNILSNTILADFAGLSPLRIDIYAQTAHDLKNKSGYWLEAKNTPLLGTEWAGTEIMQFLDAASEVREGNMLHKLTTLMGKLADKPGQTYQGIEQFYKLAVYISERKKGASIQAASKHAEKWLFNYSKIPPAIRWAKKWWAPFITFSYKAMPRMAETAITQPWKMAKYGAAMLAVEALTRRMRGESKEEEEREKRVLPTYMRTWILPGQLSHLRVPFTDQYNRSKYLDLSFILPWGDVAEQWGQSRFVGRAFLPNHPVYVSITEIAFNEILFTGQDLTLKDVDSNSEYMKKIGTQLWRQAMPSLAGSYSFNKLMTAVTGEKDWAGRERSVTEAIFDVFLGLKLRSVDYHEAYGWKLKDYRGHITAVKKEFAGKYRKLMMNPSDDPRVNEERYSKLFKETNEKMNKITDKIREIQGYKKADEE